jgi:hypothetical protein
MLAFCELIVKSDREKVEELRARRAIENWSARELKQRATGKPTKDALAAPLESPTRSADLALQPGFGGTGIAVECLHSACECCDASPFPI